MSDTPMTPEALATVLVELPGWKHDADTLAKTFVFDDFREALTFMLRVGFEADALDHDTTDLGIGLSESIDRLERLWKKGDLRRHADSAPAQACALERFRQGFDLRATNVDP